MRGALSRSPPAALTTHRWRLNPQTARLRLEADPRGGATGRAPPQACPGALALCPHSAPSVGVCPDLAKTPVRGDRPPQRPVHLHALSEGLALKTAASEDQGSGCHHTDLGGGDTAQPAMTPPGAEDGNGPLLSLHLPCWLLASLSRGGQGLGSLEFPEHSSPRLQGRAGLTQLQEGSSHHPAEAGSCRAGSCRAGAGSGHFLAGSRGEDAVPSEPSPPHPCWPARTPAVSELRQLPPASML